MWSKYLNILAICLLLVSCKNKKRILRDIEAADLKSKMEATDVIKEMKANEFEFNTLKAIIKTKFKTSSGENQSFKTLLQIQKDSAIEANVTYLNIPVLSALITKDSIKFVNKRDKKYFVGSIESVSDYFKVPVDYKNIENLLVGNAISIDTTKDHYLIDFEKEVYLSSIKKSELKEILNGNKSYDGWMYRYWINEYFRPGKTILNNPLKESSLEITQRDYIQIDDQEIPNHTTALFSNPVDTIDIKLNYNKIRLNKPLEFKFDITEKYDPYEE